jgi:hypothetical protein
MTNLVFTSGAGSTGKTSVVDALKTMAPVFGKKVVSMPSITRSVYAELGINSEGAALDMNIEDQKRLQTAINTKYYSSAEQFLNANQDADLVVIDRSPYDHITYYMHGLMMHTTAPEISGKRLTANAWIRNIARGCDMVNVVFFPFPEPWHTETESSDGFRRDPSGKNLVWSMLLEKMLEDNIGAMRARQVWLRRFPMPGMSVAERARYIMDTCCT